MKINGGNDDNVIELGHRFTVLAEPPSTGQYYRTLELAWLHKVSPAGRETALCQRWVSDQEPERNNPIWIPIQNYTMS